jgi:hypothetical protein
MRRTGLFTLTLCLACSSLQADEIPAVVFSESFTSETTTYNPLGNPWGNLNFGTFQNWNVSRGSVDFKNVGGVTNSLWYNNPAAPFSPSFSFVDLDGTSRTSGQITSKTALSLAPGSYRLSFDLAGNMGRDPANHSDGVTVRLDGLGITQHYELDWNEDFNTKNIDFEVTTPTTTNLSFANESDDPTSLNDNMGPMLANIRLLDLTGGVANVPEPATMVIAIGLAGSIYLIRRRRLAATPLLTSL